MIDLVTNHMGYIGDANTVNYGSMNPFNQQSQFHPVCWISNYGNQTEVEQVIKLPTSHSLVSVLMRGAELLAVLDRKRTISPS